MRRRTADPGAARPAGRGRLLAAIALLTALLATVVVAVPAEAARPKYPRVRAIAASADYLVYRQQTANAYGLFFPKGSALYVVGTRGGRHALPDFDPERAQTLQGSTLVQADDPAVVYDPARTEQLRWRDLRTGRFGTFQLPAAENVVGAVPGGWISTRTDGAATRLIRYTTGGKTTDLGRPLPRGAAGRVTLGPEGIVVADGNTGSGQFDEQRDSSGLIRYASFRTPGRWRTVFSAGAGIDTSCGSPSATHVVCSVEGRSAGHSGTVLLALDGGRRAWLDDHPKACAVIGFTTVGRSAVGKASSTQLHCVRGRLTRLGADGAVTTPKRNWGPHSGYLTAGFGGILLDSADQRRIVRLSTVTGAARTVVTAH